MVKLLSYTNLVLFAGDAQAGAYTTRKDRADSGAGDSCGGEVVCYGSDVILGDAEEIAVAWEAGEPL